MSTRRDERTEVVRPAKKRRRRWAVRGVLAALIVMALAYLRCGSGFGLGGGGWGFGKDEGDGKGSGEGTGMVTQQDEPTGTPQPLVGDPPAPARCQLRLDGSGLWLLGATGQEKVEIAAAAAACKQAGGAEVVVTGDAKQGAWDELKRALDEQGVASFVRGGGAPAAPAATPAAADSAAPAAPDPAPPAAN